MHLVCIFSAELHKVVAASILPNIAVMRLAEQDSFFQVFLSTVENGKIWAQKHLQKYFSEQTLDGDVHMLIS
jgi:hypothetical protein